MSFIVPSTQPPDLDFNAYGLRKADDMPSNSASGIIIRNHILPGDIGAIVMLHGIMYARASNR